MSFFSIWGITIITSTICELVNEIKIFKDFADQGYKFNMDKMKTIQTNIVPNTTSSALDMYIPFYNLYTVLKRKAMYEQNKDTIFTQYEKLGILEEMTEEEKKVYASKPTGWNAIVIAAHDSQSQQQVIRKTETKETINIHEEGNQTVKMIINETDGKTNTITVIMSTSPDDNTMKIIGLSGPIKDLSKDELTEYIITHMDLIMQGKNISIRKTEEFTEVTLTKIKPKTKLERYIELRDSLKEQGYLIGEEMFEYQDLKEELGPTLNLTK